MGSALVVQWLKLCTSLPLQGGMYLSPGQRTKIPHAIQCTQKKTKKKTTKKRKDVNKLEHVQRKKWQDPETAGRLILRDNRRNDGCLTQKTDDK